MIKVEHHQRATTERPASHRSWYSTTPRALETLHTTEPNHRWRSLNELAEFNIEFALSLCLSKPLRLGSSAYKWRSRECLFKISFTLDIFTYRLDSSCKSPTTSLIQVFVAQLVINPLLPHLLTSINQCNNHARSHSHSSMQIRSAWAVVAVVSIPKNFNPQSHKLNCRIYTKFLRWSSFTAAPCPRPPPQFSGWCSRCHSIKY